MLAVVVVGQAVGEEVEHGAACPRRPCRARRTRRRRPTARRTRPSSCRRRRSRSARSGRGSPGSRRAARARPSARLPPGAPAAAARSRAAQSQLPNWICGNHSGSLTSPLSMRSVEVGAPAAPWRPRTRTPRGARTAPAVPLTWRELEAPGVEEARALDVLLRVRLVPAVVVCRRDRLRALAEDEVEIRRHGLLLARLGGRGPRRRGRLDRISFPR